MAAVPFSCFLLKIMYFFTILTLLGIINRPLMSEMTHGFADEYPVTFESLYKSGIAAYKHERWFECYDFITKSLVEYKSYRQVLIDCKTMCKLNTTFEYEDVALELSFLNLVLQRSNCLEKCKSKNFDNGLENMVVSETEKEAFESYKPYDYLQICAFKLEKYEVAASAAYTFYLANPDHEIMRTNLQYYSTMKEIKKSYFVDLEKKMYEVYYQRLLGLYSEENFADATVAVEDTLREYYKEIETCEVLCEGFLDQANTLTNKNDLYGIMADQWIDVLHCQSKCAGKLSRIDGQPVPNFLPELYNYLQFCYYKVRDLKNAAKATASFLVFKPDDEVMVTNKEYYISDEGLEEEDFVPCKIAVEYNKKQYVLQDMVQYVDSTFPRRGKSFQPETSGGTKPEVIEKFKFTNSEARAKPQRSKGDSGIKDNPTHHNPGHNFQNDDGVDETNAAALAALGPRDKSFLTSLQGYLDQKKLELVAEEDALQGRTRVAVDGLLNEAECKDLKRLAQAAGTQGDGYSTREQKSSPHTDFEKFEGVTIAKAAELASTGEVPVELTKLYLKASESARMFLQTYYNLKTTLYFHYTHLVCRTALENQSGRKDLSHPIHADNCVMQPDKTCIRKRPAYTERDFSALLYLNGDFEGGEFFFADRDHAEQESLQPTCGRLVGFEGGTYHGVKAVNKGTRCAVAIWFTLDKISQEVAHYEAEMLLQGIKSRKQHLLSPDLKSLIDSKGYNLAMTEEELNGPERFVSDKMASQEQCEALVKLVNQIGKVGDGYSDSKHKTSPHTEFEEFKGVTISKAAEAGGTRGDGYDVGDDVDSPSSPHTDNELFEGLALIRAAQLAEGGEVSAEAVKLYLQLSQDSINFVAKYFNLPELYFDYTHLVCRTALDDSNIDRKDLSHPVHSDNCLIQPDGECKKERPAYVQRDYSALLYLNDDFVGGDFFFTHKNFTVQSNLRPKCGRLVGFNANNYHGVKAVLSGQRCAIALWFTKDPRYKEAAHGIAWNILNNMDKPKLRGPSKDESHGEL